MTATDVSTLDIVVAEPVVVVGASALDDRRASPLAQVLANTNVRVGLCVLVPILVLAAAAPVLPLPDPLATDTTISLRSPSLQHLFGTDKLGRDMFSRTLAGARISLAVGLAAAVLSLSFGIVLGTVAGFLRRWFDTGITAVCDVLLSVPSLLLAIGMVAVYGAGFWPVVAAVAVADLPRAIRLQRSLVLGLSSRSFIDAARLSAAPTRWILRRHILPNTLTSALVIASIFVANAVLVETALSFLGLGITPPTPSWGNLIADGRPYLQKGWWIATFPALGIMTVAMSLHFLADGVREVLAPGKGD